MERNGKGDESRSAKQAVPPARVLGAFEQAAGRVKVLAVSPRGMVSFDIESVEDAIKCPEILSALKAQRIADALGMEIIRRNLERFEAFVVGHRVYDKWRKEYEPRHVAVVPEQAVSEVERH